LGRKHCLTLDKPLLCSQIDIIDFVSALFIQQIDCFKHRRIRFEEDENMNWLQRKDSE